MKFILWNFIQRFLSSQRNQKSTLKICPTNESCLTRRTKIEMYPNSGWLAKFSKVWVRFGRLFEGFETAFGVRFVLGTSWSSETKANFRFLPLENQFFTKNFQNLATSKLWFVWWGNFRSSDEFLKLIFGFSGYSKTFVWNFIR